MAVQDLGVQPRPSDIFVAVMGMTGSGKSTFISLCTGEDVAVGHDLQACTQQVSVYKCKLSSSCDVYLLDTPGFDDTNRSDTEVLTEIAAWFTKAYGLNLKLSGILYLHRITDPRMQGSAKKNLFMLKKLCGEDGLKNVLLVSTMWEVFNESKGYSREQQLVNTEEFWGVLVHSGARVKRHDNSRESAMALLEELVQNKKMAMSIQKEMVTEGKTLDQTQAGIELEFELQKQKEKSKHELAELQETMRQAMAASDHESSEALRQHKADMQQKIDKIRRQREDLRVTMEAMHAEKFAELEKSHQEQWEEIKRAHEEETQELKAQVEHVTRRLDESNSPALVQKLRAQVERLTRRLDEDNSPALDSDRRSSTRRKSSAVSSTLGPCRISKRRSVALCGNRYYFLGLGMDNYSTPEGLTPNDKTMYVALGTNDSWYHHYHDGDKCWTESSDNLEVEYPALASWLTEKAGSECPVQISLGESGQYYARLHNGSWNCSLPWRIRVAVNDSVNRVWLGYKKKCAMQKKSGELVLDSMQLGYPAMFEKLLSECHQECNELLELAMNTSDPESYVVVTTRRVSCSKITGTEDLARHPGVASSSTGSASLSIRRDSSTTHDGGLPATEEGSTDK